MNVVIQKLKIVNKKTRTIMQILDFVGFLLYNVFTFWRLIKPKHRNFRKILLIDTGFIGDTVISFSTIENIKKHFKRSELHVLANPKTAAFLKENKYIDKLMFYDCPWMRYQKEKKKGTWKKDFVDYLKIREKISSEEYDVGVDLRGDARNILLLLYLGFIKRRIGYGITGLGYLLTDQVKWNNRIREVTHNLELLKPLKVKIRTKNSKIQISKMDALKIDDLLKQHKINKSHKLVAVTIAAGYATKEWSEKNMAELSKLILDKYKKTKIIVIGSPIDNFNIPKHIDKKYHKNIVDLHGKTTLVQVAALIKKCDLLIGPDTGSMHIASAVDTPTVTLFGPTDPKRWRPAGNKKKHLVVSTNEECTLCGKLHSCEEYDNKCMKNITPEMVMKEVKKLLK
jgi:heptosyltransferase-2